MLTFNYIKMINSGKVITGLSCMHISPQIFILKIFKYIEKNSTISQNSFHHICISFPYKFILESIQYFTPILQLACPKNKVINPLNHNTIISFNIDFKMLSKCPQSSFKYPVGCPLQYQDSLKVYVVALVAMLS